MPSANIISFDNSACYKSHSHLRGVLFDRTIACDTEWSGADSEETDNKNRTGRHSCKKKNCGDLRRSGYVWLAHQCGSFTFALEEEMFWPPLAFSLCCVALAWSSFITINTQFLGLYCSSNKMNWSNRKAQLRQIDTQLISIINFFFCLIFI